MSITASAAIAGRIRNVKSCWSRLCLSSLMAHPYSSIAVISCLIKIDKPHSSRD